MFTQETIHQAVDRLLQAAPGARVILFGSYARGDATEDSDLDFLVIEPEVADDWDEMVRLRDALRPLPISADVLVTSREEFDYWADTPGHVFYEARVEGKDFDAFARAG